MQVIFRDNNLPLSLAIKATTFCRWYHCGVMYGDIVFEASGSSGVKATKLRHFKKQGHWVIIEIPTNEQQDFIIKTFLYNQIGKKYDFGGIFAFLTNHRDWNDLDKWYCSEYVAAAFKRAGIPIVRDSLNGVSPRDIWVQNFPIIDSSDKRLIPS